MQKDQPPEQPYHIQDLIDDTQHSRAELLQTYHDLKKELQGFRKQSMQMFEEWLTQIYMHRMKTCDIYFMDGIEINVTPHAIETIIRRVLSDVCHTHKQLIGEQMRFMLEAGVAENYYKVDADSHGVGFFDTCVSHEWVSEPDPPLEGFSPSPLSPASLRPTTRLNVNYQYYEFCVWTIYHHYCSLSESNKQVCLLVETIRQNSQAEFYSFYREMQTKRMIAEMEEAAKNSAQQPTPANNSFPTKGTNSRESMEHIQKIARLKLRAREALNMANDKTSDNLYSPSYEDLIISSSSGAFSMDRMTDLIDQYELVRESELNILTITNLIPLAMPKIDTAGLGESYMIEECLFGSSSEQENYEELYQHINKFEQTINNIVNKSKQNMRKHVTYLEEFKRAIVILRGRLKNIRMGKHKKRAIQRQQQHQRFLEQQLLMEEQYKNDVSKELDRELRAADQEEGNDDKLKQVEEDRRLVREIEQTQQEEEEIKKIKKVTDRFLKYQKEKSQLIGEPAKKEEDGKGKKSQRRPSENSKQETPVEFGDPELLFARQKINEERANRNKYTFSSLSSEGKPDITPNHSFFDSLLSMHINGEQATIERNTSTKLTKKTSIGGSNNLITTTTLTATTTTTNSNPKASKHKQTTIFQKLEKKLKMLIDRDCTNGEQFQAVMSHLSGSGINIKASPSTGNSSEQPLVFTKAQLEKTKLNTNNMGKEELKFSKICHLHQNGQGPKPHTMSPFEAEELGLHEFIEINNLKNEREEDDNLDEIDDEEYLDRYEEEQRIKKKNKRKRNKKKKKEQQQQIKEMQKEGPHLTRNLSTEQTTANKHEDNNHDESELEPLTMARGVSKSFMTESDTYESRVVKWLKELNINDAQRESCWQIGPEVVRGWQKMMKNREKCGREQLISLSLTPNKKVSRSKKSAVKC